MPVPLLMALQLQGFVRPLNHNLLHFMPQLTCSWNHVRTCSWLSLLVQVKALLKHGFALRWTKIQPFDGITALSHICMFVAS
ncbi:uncharacterized [Tachysurus ichikawai]